MTPAEAAQTGKPLASAPAPAKINLYLHVTGRRPDGYHRLDSLVAFAGIGDTVQVYPAPEITLEIAGPFAAALGDIEENLVMRAARLLREAAGVRAGARIRLVKRLPVAAGMGGGSSDAAAALRALSAHWDGCPRGDDLARLALSLGADVPVCLSGRAALVAGIGESLTGAPALPATYLTLANPGEPLSTARVFAAFGAALGERFSRPAPFAGAPGSASELAAELARRGNDLEAPARSLVPAVGAVLEELAGEPGCLISRMSGSGPTCFGLFADAGEAARAAARIAGRRPEWWVVDAPLLDRFDGLTTAP